MKCVRDKLKQSMQSRKSNHSSHISPERVKKMDVPVCVCVYACKSKEAICIAMAPTVDVIRLERKLLWQASIDVRCTGFLLHRSRCVSAYENIKACATLECAKLLSFAHVRLCVCACKTEKTRIL